MQPITSISELKYSIKLLEVEQEMKGELLKKEFYIVYESLKPANLVINTLSDIFSSNVQTDNLSGTAMGLTTGYLTKKVFTGTSGNAVRKILGLILQFGVTNLVTKNSESIKSFAQILIQHFLQRRKSNPENGVR